MSIPFRGMSDIFKNCNWVNSTLEDEASKINPGVIEVTAGKLHCPKYNTTVHASQCSRCGECISPVNKVADTKTYIVKCAFKKESDEEEIGDLQYKEANNEVEAAAAAAVEEEYDWEEEQIKKLEKIINKNLKKDASWEQVNPSQKLSSPNDIYSQLRGTKGVVKVPSAYSDDGMGDRGSVPTNSVSIFETEDLFAEKISQFAKSEDIVKQDVEERKARKYEQRKEWEVSCLDNLEEILNKKKAINGVVTKIANESSELTTREVPTGKLGIGEKEIRIVDQDDSIEKEKEIRAMKKREEWNQIQDQTQSEYEALKEKFADKYGQIHSTSHDQTSESRFGSGSDKISMMDSEDFAGLKEEKDNKEIIRESRQELKNRIGVREKKEDRSWEDKEYQRSKSVESQIMQDVLSKISDPDKLLSERPM